MNENMNQQQRAEILKYGSEFGIAKACRKYSISRTIYYRWKKRFEESGMDGLKNRVRQFTPVNKIDSHIEHILFQKVAQHPDYGPLSLKWLLEEEHIYISASAVYNILKRNNISRRNERFIFSRRHKKKRALPAAYKAAHGKLWLSWTDERSDLIPGETIYQYSIMDVSSGVSCSRLYNEKNSTYALDLLTGLALPMGRELYMKPEILITPGDRIYSALRPRGTHPYSQALKTMNIRQIKWDIDFNDFKEPAQEFSRQSLQYLKELNDDSPNLQSLRRHLQDFLRSFNLEWILNFGQGKGYSPVQNVERDSQQKISLPIWAYLERKY